MENENEDSQKTKLSENGMLCIGQKDSQKDSVLSKEYPRQMPIIYIESKRMSNKNMQKTSQNNRTAIDKSEKIVYNTLMKNKNNNKTKQTGLGRHPLTMKGSNMIYTYEIVASQIKSGLTNELQIICEIGKVLRSMGKSRTEVNYFMNVDSDFITDVLSCYNG